MAISRILEVLAVDLYPDSFRNPRHLCGSRHHDSAFLDYLQCESYFSPVSVQSSSTTAVSHAFTFLFACMPAAICGNRAASIMHESTRGLRETACKNLNAS